jgi:hypothetical protein
MCEKEERKIGIKFIESLSNFPTVQAGSGANIVQAVFEDANSQKYYSLPFEAANGADLLMWVAECRTVGKMLGLNRLMIYSNLYSGEEEIQLIGDWKRSRFGDWISAT